MDKSTRNAIERATQQARKLLDEDFSSQLEGTFDVLRSGVIAPKGGVHLSARQQFQRDKIIAAIAHKRAAGMAAVEAVTDYVRDAAFTTLNRFVALKMLEARELVQECITKGEQSAGYREFCGMAPGVALLPDAAGYRLYVESLFDEFSTEIKILFDRRDAASVLWPKRQTFERLLAILNAQELSTIWGEDETIGWVYQFFNSGEERKKMRDESQAPRNSRELAVRNQFFTPRYVVQFLADNTLGRLWLEMHGDKTCLATLCEYLASSDESVQPRPRKDPRDLRILDPACGSGHFLLYSFDLLLAIYEEAWSPEETAPRSAATGRTLRDDYPDLVDLRRAVPRLVVEENLFGVDIDPRCAQIAALALWLRAQRAWKDLDIAASERPRIHRTHIVVAEPMPGDAALVDEFAARLDPPLLRDLFKKMVSESRLAGELGTLLRLEDGIATELRCAREQFVKQRDTMGFLPGMEPLARQGALDLSGIDDDRFFHEAEARIVEALRSFAETTNGGASVRRRLFAGDAAQGIALIDLIRTRFDVVLMNPPFGAQPAAGKSVLDRSFPSSKPDLLCAFIERARELVSEGGYVGAITNRTVLFGGSLKDWRCACLLDEMGLTLLADLGHGVLDDAMVEAAAYVIGRHGPNLGYNLLNSTHKDTDLRRACAEPAQENASRLALNTYRLLPRNPIAYWAPATMLQKITALSSLERCGILPRVGIQTSSNFRFLRLQWEVSPKSIADGTWVPFAKGGDYSPFADSIHLCVLWSKEAREQRAFCDHHEQVSGSSRGNDARREFEYYFKPGLAYSERTTSDISVRVLARGCINGDVGPGIFCVGDVGALEALAVMSTSTFKQFLEINVGLGDAVHSGSAARHYTVGTVAQVPFPELDSFTKQRLSLLAQDCVAARREVLSLRPTSAGAFRPALLQPEATSLADASKQVAAKFANSFRKILLATKEIEALVQSAYALEKSTCTYIEASAGVHPLDLPNATLDLELVTSLWQLEDDALVDRCKQIAGASRSITKKAWWADRRVEIISAAVGVNAAEIIRLIEEGKILPKSLEEQTEILVDCLLSRCFGDQSVAMGRWYDDPFDENWAKCGRERADNLRPAILVDDHGHERDVEVALTAELCKEWGGEHGLKISEELGSILGGESGSLRTWLRKSCFAKHIEKYSKSRRKAPILWQFSTPSAGYSVWVYIHAFTHDTMHTIQNDFAMPKLQHEERRLQALRVETAAHTTLASRKEVARQELFVEALRAFVDEVRRVAPLWRPNLDDGVIINFAPLWRLVPHHKTWQKELKASWDALCAGEHDWAHLSMHLWPERVVPKCATDRSLAIAHGLEDVFWVQERDGKWKPRIAPTRPVDELVGERTSFAVKAALNNLLETPVASVATSRGRGRRAGAAAVLGGTH